MKILIINGHPNLNSFNFALSKSYKKGALESGAKVRQLNIAELDFCVFSLKSFNTFVIPDDLIEAQNSINWSNHIVFIHPIWWGTIPALMKTFFEQTFVPDFSFKQELNGKITKLLNGKTASIITTMDTPFYKYKYFFKEPSYYSIKTNLNFCGINPVKRTYYASINKSTKEQREKWLRQTEQLGKQQKL